jgi:hypothetical protein
LSTWRGLTAKIKPATTICLQQKVKNYFTPDCLVISGTNQLIPQLCPELTSGCNDKRHYSPAGYAIFCAYAAQPVCLHADYMF